MLSQHFDNMIQHGHPYPHKLKVQYLALFDNILMPYQNLPYFCIPFLLIYKSLHIQGEYFQIS